MNFVDEIIIVMETKEKQNLVEYLLSSNDCIRYWAEKRLREIEEWEEILKKF